MGSRPQGAEALEYLKPLPRSQRPYSLRSFTWMMFSMNTCIPMFFLGAIAYKLGIGLWEAIGIALLGNLATVIVMILNGLPGYRYGIPYPIQARAAFGSKGYLVPVVLRAIVGAGWYGIEAYNACLALLFIALLALGVPAPQITSTAVRLVLPVLAGYIVLATLVTMKGLKGIGVVAEYGGPLLLLYFAWLLAYIVLGGRGSSLITSTAASASFTALLTYLAVQTNWWATVALNISDLTRGVDSPVTLIVAPLLGIVGGQVLGTFIGYELVALTGKWLPQEIVLLAPTIPAIVLGEIFCFLAPFSTDVTANIPPVLDLTVGVTRRWSLAVILACAIGFIVAPWWAVEKGPDIVSYVTAFASNYGVLLGPIAGILLADYYIVRRGRYNLEEIYNGGVGFNWAALGSLVASIALCYAVSIALNQTVHVGLLVFPSPLSWYIGLASGLVIYTIASLASYRRRLQPS